MKLRSEQCFQKPSVFKERCCWPSGMPISSDAPQPLGPAYVRILLSEVEQEQRPTVNGVREAIVLGAGLCNGEGEHAYTVNDPILDREKYLKDFKRF